MPLDLVTLIMSLAPKYRKGAKLYGSTDAVETLRKMLDGNGMPLWREADSTAGRPQSIMGHFVEECPAMPSVAAGAKCLMFGDLAKAYKFVSHESGLQILRDPFTDPAFIKLPTKLYCGSGPMDTRALKVLQPIA